MKKKKTTKKPKRTVKVQVSERQYAAMQGGYTNFNLLRKNSAKLKAYRRAHQHTIAVLAAADAVQHPEDPCKIADAAVEIAKADEQSSAAAPAWWKNVKVDARKVAVFVGNSAATAALASGTLPQRAAACAYFAGKSMAPAIRNFYNKVVTTGVPENVKYAMYLAGLWGLQTALTWLTSQPLVEQRKSRVNRTTRVKRVTTNANLYKALNRAILPRVAVKRNTSKLVDFGLG
ncbi:hypothetical protein EBT25_10950 [bacterium]|nr:hypothetical protein [bacterium]